MPAEYFLDTNILIYTVGNIIPQKKTAVDLIGSQAVISTQSINESINVMYRKFGYDYAEIRSIIDIFIDQIAVYPVTIATIRSALNIAERYGYSYYDSQVIASALERDCPILYSEDLQPEQMIEGRLKIVNPFL